MVLLLGPHAVVVEPVDDGLDAHTQLCGQTLNGGLVGVGVLVVRCPQGLFLLLRKEDAGSLGGGGRVEVLVFCTGLSASVSCTQNRYGLMYGSCLSATVIIHIL